MAEIGSESQFFFSGNIANMIPEGPLNKMIPLTEDHGGGGGGGGGVLQGPPLAHGLSQILYIRPTLIANANGGYDYIQASVCSFKPSP